MSYTKQNKMLALVDCDSFYCSCERLFNAKARRSPVIVLSNNDGCVISRSKEAKDLGIGMAVPFFQIRDLVEKEGVMVFSSNYALYGDISKRVMQTLSEFSPQVEVYSIDEAFLDLTSLPIKDYESYAKKIRETVLKEIGIPVSVAMAPTKVLTKVASKFAKKENGVFVIENNTAKHSLLSKLSVEDVWGIGSASAQKLRRHNINNAYELMNADEFEIQRLLTVVGRKILLELRGESVIKFVDENDEREKRKIISNSKSFEFPIYDKKTLKEAVSNHAMRTCEKLRGENLLAYAVQVFVYGSYYNSEIFLLKKGSDQYEDILEGALKVLENLYVNGHAYKKCGVALMDLGEKSEIQIGLFENDTKVLEKEKVSNLMDQINQKFGKHTLSVLACGASTPWDSSGRFKSKAFTTRWKELLQVV